MEIDGLVVRLRKNGR